MMRPATTFAEEFFTMRPWRTANLFLIFLVLSLAAMAQQGSPNAPKPQTPAQQPLPDAPAPSKQIPREGVPSPSTGEASSADTAAATEQQTPEPNRPAQNGRIIPSNRAANETSSGYDETLGIIKVNVNAVPIPVTVKDASGRLFPGLHAENFSVYEDGVKQRISFFTSDPFPVSAAIVIDTGMPEIALRKVKDTFSALIGAFSQFDEVALYTYGNTVERQQDYLAAFGETTQRTLNRIKSLQGRASGPNVFNPMTVGPTVNGRAFDPGTMRNIETAPPKDAEPSRVLNDALLQAAIDLGRREKARRRVIFIVSDGRENGSRASYSDVLKVLETNNITVYGVAVDASAIPYYDKLTKIRLPRQGYSNILPKYASATGGEIFTEFTQQALETAYGSAMEESRSQYTLIYYTNATMSTSFRKIEVRVSGYGPSLKVYARDGYYPAPQQQ
jgi:VWFA-related protein